MTLLPAKRLESCVPQMKKKGRLRVGANADITIFDRARSWTECRKKPDQASIGVAHVL